MSKIKYIKAYKELEQLIKVKSRNYTKIKELLEICQEGQNLGIKELQKL